LGLAIGDVIGHGIGAATMMGELRAALRAYALAQPHSPAEALASLNALVAHTPATMVATLLYIVVDADGTGVRFASAAHPPPVLMRPDGRVRLLKHKPAPPLGVARHSEFAEYKSELPPGGTMLLYTDGLIERRGEPIDVGIDRLGKALQNESADLEELCTHILALAQNSSSTQDDVALVAVRRRTADADAGALELELPAEPASVPLSRHRLERWLSATPASDDEVFAITLAANEACTNAVQHAYGPEPGRSFRLFAELSAEEIAVQVSDSGRWRTARGRQRGMGLGVIEQLMDTVDVQRTAAGTTVDMRKRFGGDARR
jgi:anti-sigma regulatory factor (Ser/Thr protein kinase)